MGGYFNKWEFINKKKVNKSILAVVQRNLGFLIKERKSVPISVFLMF